MEKITPVVRLTDHAIRCSEHVADVRSACRIGEHGGLQISSSEAMANSQAENIDYLIHMRTDQMGPQNVFGALLHQNFMAINALRHAPGCIPIRRLLALHAELPA